MRPRVLLVLPLLAGFAAAPGLAQPPTAPAPRPAVDPILDGLIFRYAPAPVAQPSPPRPTPSSPVPTSAPQDQEYAPLAWPVGAQSVRPASPVVAPVDLPLDMLVAELKAIQAQKAALAKREADVAKEVRKRLAEYTEALDKLGHGPARQNVPYRSGPIVEPAPLLPPAVDPDPQPLPSPSAPPAGRRRGTPDEATPRNREPVPSPTPVPNRS
jgi:hypothetical protein